MMLGTRWETTERSHEEEESIDFVRGKRTSGWHAVQKGGSSCTSSRGDLESHRNGWWLDCKVWDLSEVAWLQMR